MWKIRHRLNVAPAERSVILSDSITVSGMLGGKACFDGLGLRGAGKVPSW